MYDDSRIISSMSSQIGEDIVSFYEKPQYIENMPLLDGNNRILKSLVEHFDYEVLPLEIWKHLNSWYQCDRKICRRLIRD
jgi:hypothetical protein